MKKAAVILFTIYYLVLASGLSINLHYCGGKLKEISFLGEVNEDGCCGKKEKSKGCCNEESTFIKVKDDQFAGSAVKVLINTTKAIPIAVFSELFIIQDPHSTYTSLSNHSPPVVYDNPIYLKYKVLII